MLPVEAICNPGNKDIECTLTTVLAPHFETEFGVGIKYTAACKIRNNNSVSKNMILTTLGKIIKEMNPRHQLCHDEPDLVIIVEIVQKACCFSVVKDYFKFKKYNLHKIIKKPTVEETKEDKTKEDVVELDNDTNVENIDKADDVEADNDDNVENTVKTEELNENIEKTGEEDVDKDKENVIEEEVNETADSVDNVDTESVEKCEETKGNNQDCENVETIQQTDQEKLNSPEGKEIVEET